MDPRDEKGWEPLVWILDFLDIWIFFGFGLWIYGFWVSHANQTKNPIFLGSYLSTKFYLKLGLKLRLKELKFSSYHLD
jgi:hypothetical protein